MKIKTKAIASAKLGESITDTATITDAFTNKTSASDGTVTFKAYKDAEDPKNPTTCTGTADFTSPPIAVDLDTSTEVTSTPFSPKSVGTYYWIATFHSTADPQATDISTTCKEAEESSVVKKAKPTIETNASGPVTVGSDIHDTATIKGLIEPTKTATINFKLYGPNDPTCTHEPLNGANGQDVTVDQGNGNYESPAFTTGLAGSYHWVAHYSGDENNEKADSACGDKGETSVVEKASPEIATEATATATVGEDISDVATLSRLVSPTGAGEVTFDIYKGADCSGQVLETLGATPASVTENGEYTSEDFDTTASGVGTYHWIAHFSGDANNEAVSGQCSDENENTASKRRAPN